MIQYITFDPFWNLKPVFNSKGFVLIASVDTDTAYIFNITQCLLRRGK